MKRTLVWILFIEILLLVACKPTEKTQRRNPFNELSGERQSQVKFTYTFSEATKYHMLNMPQKAILYFKQAIELNAESASAHYLLSKTYYQLQQFDSAFVHAQKAVSLMPDNEYILLYLAQLYYQNQEIDKAIELYDSLVRLNPDKEQYYFDLASLYKQVRQFELAIETLDKYEAVYGISEKASIQKNQLYTYLLDHQSAYNELDNLIKKYPKNVQYYGIMAEYLMANQRFEEAKLFFDQAFSFSPNNGLINISLAGYYIRIQQPDSAYEHLLFAYDDPEIDYKTKLDFIFNSFENNSNSVFSDKQLEQLFQVLETNYPTQPDLFSVQAEFYIDNRKFDLAITKIIKALDIEKSTYKLWEKLFQLEYELNRNSDLLKHTEEAMQYFPNQPYVYLFAGISSQQLKNDTKALQYFQMGADVVVDNNQLLAQFFLSIADIYHAQNNYSQSDLFYEKVLKVDPNNIFALNNFSYYLSLRNIRLDEAKVMSKKAIMLEPRNPTYLDTHAWVLYVMGDYDQALIFIRKAMEYGGSENTDILDHYAEILLKNNLKSEALQQWNRLLEIKPSAEGIQNKIDRINN